MCTVSYLPKENQNFILTSSRDEMVGREKAIFPNYINDRVLFPKDGRAGGTWLASSKQGRVICLLNGAFQKHIKRESYRMSRGKVVTEAIVQDDIQAFLEDFNLIDVEPFTLVIIEKFPSRKLTEFRWDGNQKHIFTLDDQKTHIWSSATLYPPEIKTKRELWFAQWQIQNEFTVENVLDFHKNAGDGDPENDVVMKRQGGMQTISITTVEALDETIEMDYNDILDQKNRLEILTYA